MTLQERATEVEVEPDPGTEPVEEPIEEDGLWTIIGPVNREIYSGMGLSLLSLLGWFGSVVLFLPIAQEISSDDPDRSRLWTLIGISVGLVIVSFISRTLSFRISRRLSSS